MTKKEIIKYLEHGKDVYNQLIKEHIDKFGDDPNSKQLHFLSVRFDTFSDILKDILK